MAIRDAIIAVDFDGTVVTHAYPHIGNDIGAVPVLRELIGNGCRVILYTMRSGRLLDDAVAWFTRNDIPLYAVNENPAQREWTDSPKVFADLYIDDSALGCPIKFEDGIKRPFLSYLRKHFFPPHPAVFFDLLFIVSFPHDFINGLFDCFSLQTFVNLVY